LTSRDRKFWAKVWARREKLAEAVKILRRRVAADLMPPKGSPPFSYRAAYEASGRRPVAGHEVEEARALFLRRTAARRADIEEATYWGLDPAIRELYSLCRTPGALAEYAIGVHWLEMRDAKRKANCRSPVAISPAGLRDPHEPYFPHHWGKPIDPQKRELLDFLEATNAQPLYAESILGEYGDVASGDAIGRWRQDVRPYTADEVGWSEHSHPMPWVSPAERALLASILAKSPCRKRGRPPKNGRAMTNTERSRRHRAKELA
jgi:hypothetical protein